MNNENNFEMPDIASGINTPTMCDQCICMICNKGPNMYKSCQQCMTCKGPVHICPVKNFDYTK